MKNRWLSLAVSVLMVFALITQGLAPVLAEEEIVIDPAEEALNIEAEIPVDGDEEEFILGEEFPVEQIDEELTIDLEDLSLELDADGIVQNVLPEEGSEGAVRDKGIWDYVVRRWNGVEVVSKTEQCKDYTYIEPDAVPEELNGWYVVYADVSSDERLTVTGTANIVLYGKLYLEDGLRVPPGMTLNIYSGDGEIGELYCDADTNDNAALGGDEGEGCGTITIHGGTVHADTKNLGEDAAGIGGGEDGNGGTITIYGGNVTGIGGSGEYNGGAGIGGGGAGSGGTITIYGGNVTAQGGANAAGIGGGDEGSSGVIAIYGGTINATGGSTTGDGGAGIGGGNERGADSITIRGGNITAHGGCDGAGIGGGDCGSGGIITIDGGTITANGGDNGAGIGGGQSMDGSNITINGGTINATGGANGAGIGGGDGANSGTVTINDGDITAQGGEDAAGIGGGNNAVFANITIKGGIVNATGGDFAAGIGGGDRDSDTPGGGAILISGGQVTAQGGKDGAGIGGGEDTTGGTITISGGTVDATGGDQRGDMGIYESGGAGIGGGDDADGGTIIISGGKVKANGGRTAAGIGGGDGSDGGDITISGGEVTAIGGYWAAGIGGGEYGNGGRITITGGKVKANGVKGGAGIGGGSSWEDPSRGGNGGIITISGGEIIADNGPFSYSAGIGNGQDGDGATITLTHSGTNSVHIFVSRFVYDPQEDDSTTLKLEKPFKDRDKGTVFEARTYVNSDACNLEGIHLVPEDMSATPHKIDKKDARHLKVTTDKHSSLPGMQVTVTAVVDGAVYQPSIYVLKASDGSKLFEVPMKSVKTANFTGTFKMPDCNIIVTGKATAGSADTHDKKPSRITLKSKTAIYTGKSINIGKARVTGSRGKVTYAYYSDAKCTKKVSKHVNAGTYYVKARVAADDSYRAATSKAVKLTIIKALNPMTVSPKAKAFRKDALTKAHHFAIKVQNAKGKVTYKALSKAKKAGIRVTKDGVVTIPKNCQKGTYKIRVLADGTRNYKAKDYYVIVTVK